MRWAAAFSSSPVAPRLGFSRPSSSATIRTVVQSLMEPSHNDPLNHMPAHLSCNFGAPQPRQQRWCSFGTLCNLASNFRWSRSTSSATSVAPGNLSSNFSAPGQPRQRLRQQLRRYSRSTSPATSVVLVNLASNFGQEHRQLFGRSGSRQQLRRTLVIFASNLGGPESTSPATSAVTRSTSPATSALLVNLASNFASNFGAPGHLRQQFRRVNLDSNFGGPRQPQRPSFPEYCRCNT